MYSQFARIRPGQSFRLPAKRFASTHSGGSRSNLYVSFVSATLAATAAAFIYPKLTGTTNPPAPARNTKSTVGLGELVYTYATKSEREQAFDEIEQLVGKQWLSRSKDALDEHADTSWSTHHAEPDERPGIVVFPSSTEQVSQIMRIAHKYRVPVVPFSGGTSLEGHFTPRLGGISVDFGRMDKVIAYHKEDLDVVVQPGLGWEALNDFLQDDNLFFAPDPGPGAMIGGMVGTSCSGTNAGRYGTMRDNVLSLTVVLADGTIVKTRQRPRKSSAGYNLTGLFVGSEGTLGLVTEATLKLTPKPLSESVSVVSFNTIRDAADTVMEVVQSGIAVAAVELLDDVVLKGINQAGTTDRQWTEKPTLFFKFAGTGTVVANQIETVREIASKHESQSFEFAKDEAERLSLWSARKHALWSAIEAAPDGCKNMWTTDVAVPISGLPEIISHTKEDLVKSGFQGGIVGHVLDGNYHCLIAYAAKDHDKVAQIVDRMVYKAIEMEGTATGEHGIGVGKMKYLQAEVGQTGVDLMRAMKAQLDPLGILNPGKVFEI